MIHLDTHVVAWLYGGRQDLLSRAARELIESEDLAISPLVTLELEYLYEVGKTTEAGRPAINDLATRIGLRTSTTPFEQVVNEALRHSWTRDPFDRLIVSQAIVEGTRLLTKDRIIHKNFADAVWD